MTDSVEAKDAKQEQQVESREDQGMDIEAALRAAEAQQNPGNAPASEPVDPDPHSTSAVTHYVGIGASAGGLEALQIFFDQMPEQCPLAFFVVQHLSPDFKSVMSELLSRHTTLQVQPAVDGLSIQPNNVYLIPPGKNMMLSGEQMVLVDQKRHRGNNFPIDIFLNSLAENHRERSIAVILSGTGSDGSRGISTIKEFGGLVIAQEPEDAKFNGMPLSALRSGAVDIVAPVSEIPDRLFNYTSNPYAGHDDETLKLDPKDSSLSIILRLLRDRSEINFQEYKRGTVIRRLQRRMALKNVRSLEDYQRVLLRDSQELKELWRDLLIGVTRFFRDSEAFAELEQKVIPKIVENSDEDGTIRVWIAGCSSGEEAYSIAILLDEALRARNLDRTIKVFATDVDPDAITNASNAHYNLSISGDVSEQRLQQYFTLQHDYYVVKPRLRKMVIFATHNLLRDPPFSNCQLAVCRNVLIYFQPDAQQRIMSMLHFAVQTHGYLFLGASESLGPLSQHFEVVHERSRLYCKTSTSRTLPLSMKPPPQEQSSGDHRTPTVSELLHSHRRANRAPAYMPALERMIDEYAPTAVIVTEKLEIMHVIGDISAFTRPIRSGRFTTLLHDFILDDLSIAGSTALNRAFTDKESVTYSDVHFNNANGDEMVINLRALYVHVRNMLEPHAALIFEELHKSEPTAEIKVAYNASEESRQRIQDLEEALRRSRENLQVTVEELEATNEELQSSNEELMAANEEMQSTNEELQSVNEELYSVNSEYQEKLSEITEVNADIDNIIKSAEFGFILLDDAMLIRRFSPLASRLANLITADLGRPFHHISHALEYDTFLADIARVIESDINIEKEVRSAEGHHLLIRIAPYLRDDNQSDGCVISLTDISEMRGLRHRLESSYQELQGTLDTIITHPMDIRVLVIDDNQVDGMATRKILEKVNPAMANYSITTATSLNDALAHMKDRDFDVCLVDYYLGDAEGIDVINKLVARSNRPAFIFVSGVVNEELSRELTEAGVFDLITKDNLSAPLLERSIRYALRHKRTCEYLMAHRDDPH